MDGYSAWPFRSICRELGSAMSYTEFVNVNDILARPGYVLPKMQFAEEERPVAVQIYGEDPDQITEAALEVEDLGPDIIDINMGCPSKSIVNRGAGVGLMRTPLVIARIFRQLTARVKTPVSGKIRLGWDEDCQTYPLVARIIEENGGQALAVHGRTKAQGYGGTANWDAIAEVVAAVNIPVIGNGDVNRVADIQRMIAHTGCAGVMIGRAAIDNPWIFAGLDREQVDYPQVRALMLRHLERNLEFYSPRRGLVLFRKHAARYLTPYKLPTKLRKQLLTRETPDDFLALLQQIEPELGMNKISSR